MQTETDNQVVHVAEARAFVLYRQESSTGRVCDPKQKARPIDRYQRRIAYGFFPALLGSANGTRPVGVFNCDTKELTMFIPQDVAITVAPLVQTKVQSFLDEVASEIAQIDLASAAQALLDENLFERRYDDLSKGYTEWHAIATFCETGSTKQREHGTWL